MRLPTCLRPKPLARTCMLKNMEDFLRTNRHETFFKISERQLDSYFLKPLHDMLEPLEEALDYKYLAWLREVVYLRHNSDGPLERWKKAPSFVPLELHLLPFRLVAIEEYWKPQESYLTEDQIWDLKQFRVIVKALQQYWDREERMVIWPRDEINVIILPAIERLKSGIVKEDNRDNVREQLRIAKEENRELRVKLEELREEVIHGMQERRTLAHLNEHLKYQLNK